MVLAVYVGTYILTTAKESCIKDIGSMLFLKVLLSHAKGKLILTSFSLCQNGETPFMLAVEGGHEECSRVLLAGGSDVNIPNKVCNLGCDQPCGGRMA